MTNVLIVPEKNEQSSPLGVVEEGLRSRLVDAVYVVDGWSTDDTFETLEEALPSLAKKYGKSIELHRSRLRNTGKGGAMVTGMEIAMSECHSNVAFVDADVSSVTSDWFDYMIDGVGRYDADMCRGYFDRSPFDAQITRHITIPAINMFFPEGRGISQPLGGELCMKDSFVRHLLEYPLSPPHTWGIDTFITVTALVGGFKVVELYLSQKLHKGKKLSDLNEMLLECFDEMAKLIRFHARDEDVPVHPQPRVITIPQSESGIERVGPDVRTLAYTDPDAEVESLLQAINRWPVDLGPMRELGFSAADKALLTRLLENPSILRTEGGLMDAMMWVRMLETLFRGYIDRQFSGRYAPIIATMWRLRALAFYLNEAPSFEEAEENTKRQADYAFELSQAAQKRSPSK